MRIDPHVHTKTGSDGNLAVEEVLQKAKTKGIDLLSVTDHESIDSQKRAVALTARYGISYTTGGELNVTFDYADDNVAKSVSLDFLG